MTWTDAVADAVIVGGGPAGLTAGLYLARFRRSVLIVDNAQSRTRLITGARNVSGFEGGVGGRALLRSIRRQCEEVGVRLVDGTVLNVRPLKDAFEISLASQTIRARAILMATGVRDNRPDFPEHDRAVEKNLLRYCPVCDGYEARGLSIAVVGNDDHAASEAVFLRTFTDDITLVPFNSWAFFGNRDEVEAAGVKIADQSVAAWRLEPRFLRLALADGASLAFQRVYCALGVEPQSRLAIGLGAATDPDGCLLVDRHQQTSIAGLFAAGDISEGLDQISVAIGQGATAATAMHNMLRQKAVVKPAPIAAAPAMEATIASEGQEEVFSHAEVALGVIEHKNGAP